MNSKKPDTLNQIIKKVDKEENKKRENKIMKKINKETVKTIVISVLVTGIVMFILGMQYQAQLNNLVEAKAASLVKSATVKPPVPSKQ